MDYNSDNYSSRNTEIITYKFNDSSDFFILEWISFISYFSKFCNFLDYFIIKSLARNYYSDNTFLDSRYLITKIIKNLNYHIFGFVHFEYFTTFEFSINRFKYLKDYITSNRDFPLDRKKNFINFIISSLELLNQIIIIFQENNRFPYYDNNFKVFFSAKETILINYLPIVGDINKKINSFWCSQHLITNNQYLEFVKNKGYYNHKYWSKDGLLWLKSTKINCPKNWYQLDNKWFIRNIDIESTEINNFPVTNISYFEAEACAKYYNGRLPTEEEWNWISSNRNKTRFPYGIDLPVISGIISDFLELDSVNLNNHNSMMDFYHLYGNVWEFTSNIKKDLNNNISVCLKGGDWLTPHFILNNSLQMHIYRESQDYFSGFRIVVDNSNKKI